MTDEELNQVENIAKDSRSKQAFENIKRLSKSQNDYQQFDNQQDVVVKSNVSSVEDEKPLIKNQPKKKSKAKCTVL